MNDKEGKDFIERAEKMVARLTKALYADDEDDEVTGSLMLYVAAKFTASILLTIQEEAYNFHVEDEFLDVVKGLMKVMGKDLRIQKLKNEREEIEKMLAENEIKLAEYEEKVAKCERQFDALKQEKDMILNTHEDDLLN
jgi:16S rRNA C967 or C1407 C5-methylase (RsmB/RsmF family)